MDKIEIKRDNQFYITFNNSSVSFGLKSQPLHYTVSFGRISKIADIHITNEPDDGVKDVLYCLRYFTIGRIFATLKEEQKTFFRSMFSVIKPVSEVDWRGMVLQKIDGGTEHDFFDLENHGKRLELKESIPTRSIENSLYCPCELKGKINQPVGFIAHKWKGNSLKFQNLVIALPNSKGTENFVVIISKRQMQRWVDKMIDKIKVVVQRELLPDNQENLKNEIQQKLRQIALYAKVNNA